jgi:hypothetical protein
MTEYIVVCDEKGIPEYPRKIREEIVRCRDCKWFDDEYTEPGVCYLPNGDGGFASWCVEPDGFCAWAERKSEL